MKFNSDGTIIDPKLEELRKSYVDELVGNMDPEDMLTIYKETLLSHLQTLSEDELLDEIIDIGMEYLIYEQEVIEC